MRFKLTGEKQKSFVKRRDSFDQLLSIIIKGNQILAAYFGKEIINVESCKVLTSYYKAIVVLIKIVGLNHGGILERRS